MNTLLQDLRYGFRLLLKSPGFSLVAILTLALGIGANTSIFSVINAAMIRTLPVRDPQRLAIIGDPTRVHSFSTGTPRSDVFSAPLYQELARQQDAFDGLAATGHFDPTPNVSLKEGATPFRAEARLVSGNFFSVLGIDAVLGRVFNSDDDLKSGADPVAVISYNFWERHLSRDPGAVGRTLRVNGYPLTIIGVMPQGFTGEVVGDSIGLWIPINMQEQVMPGDHRLNDVEASWLILMGRLKPGLSLQQAQARMDVVYQRVATSGFAARFTELDNQKALRENKIEVSSGARGLSQFRHNFSKPLWLLMGIVGLVLLIACVNVANLMLARSASRRKEIAVRLAVGASAPRMFRQLITESVLLSLIGGGLGLLFAQWGTRGLLAIARSGSAVPLDTSPDPLVLAFTLGVCVLTGILFGMAPALHSGRVELTEALNATARGEASSVSRWSTGRVLVAAQVALSMVVLFAGGLLVHSLRNLRNVNTGYERRHLLLLNVNPRTVGYDGPSYITFCNELLDRLRTLPGVTAATYSENGLYSGSESGYRIDMPGFEQRASKDLVVNGDTVGPNYFTAVGIPLLAGRDIGPQDLGGQPKVVVINQTMAKFYFGSENVIGRTVQLHSQEYANSPLQVVGVSADVRDHHIDKPSSRRLYMPVGKPNLPAEVNFEIRTAADPTSLEAQVRSAVAAANSQLVINRLDAEDVLVNDSVQQEAFVAQLSGFFAGLALLLACVGLYGITAYAVAGRTREIGVRIAIGADPRQVRWLVLRETLLLISAGLIIGVPGAIAASRLMRSMVFDVGTFDPVSLALSLGLIALVGLAAAYVPARRASAVDPMVALRYE